MVISADHSQFSRLDPRANQGETAFRASMWSNWGDARPRGLAKTPRQRIRVRCPPCNLTAGLLDVEHPVFCCCGLYFLWICKFMWLCIFVWYYYSAKRTYGGAWRQCFLTKIWRFYNTNCILVAIKTLSANDSWSGKLWILGGSLQFGSVRSQHSMMWPCIAHERRFFWTQIWAPDLRWPKYGSF